MLKSNVKKNVIRLLTIPVLLVVVACSETTSEAPVVENEQVIKTANIYPDQFFTSGYIESYSVTGSDTSGSQYVGSFEVKTEAEMIFDGQVSIPVTRKLTYSAVIGGVPTAPFSAVLIEYFSVDIPRKYLGSEYDSGVITLPTSGAVELPLLITGESSGVLGDFIGTDSSVESISWSVVENSDTTYTVNFMSRLSDSAGGLLSTEDQSFVITAEGERMSWSLSSHVVSLGKTFTFSGVKQ